MRLHPHTIAYFLALVCACVCVCVLVMSQVGPNTVLGLRGNFGHQVGQYHHGRAAAASSCGRHLPRQCRAVRIEPRRR